MSLVLVPQIVPVPAGKPPGKLNCNPCCGATCVIHATGGAKRPTGSAVRDFCLEPSGQLDVSGGTNLRQVADALDRGFGVEMDVRTPDEYADFRTRMRKNRNLVASVSVGYSAFRGTPAYASRSGFMGNHQAVVRAVGLEWEMAEPLADGNGVPLGPVRISDALLRKAAGALVITQRINGRDVSWPLGAGKVYVGYVQGPAAPAPARHSVRFSPGSFFVYPEVGERIADQFAKVTSARCEAPSWRSYKGGRRKLAKVLAGRLKGRYVEPGRAHVALVTA